MHPIPIVPLPMGWICARCTVSLPPSADHCHLCAPQLRTCPCGTGFKPRRTDQTHCEPGCRKRAEWRKKAQARKIRKILGPQPKMAAR